MAELKGEAVSLEAGKIYRFAGILGPKQPNGSQPYHHPPADYRLLGTGVHMHTHQELVAYVGAGGADDGRMFFCGLMDWHKNFSLKPVEIKQEMADGRMPTGMEDM